MNIDNSTLFTLKKELLNQSYSHSTFLYSRCFYIHGVELTVCCNAEYTLDKIVSWVGEVPSKSHHKITVYLFTPEELDISTKDWCDESSQDCWSDTKDGLRYGIQRDFAARELTPDCFYAVLGLEYSDGLYNFLRWLLPSYLLESQQAIIHSACVLSNKKEALFFLGYSGAGKTTITSLAGARDILGDDMNRLFISDNVVSAGPGGVGGAFEPSVPIDSSFPVKAFFWLKQSNRNQVVTISKTAAFQRLFSSFVGWSWENVDHELQQKMMSFIDEVLRDTPMYELEFTKEVDAWKKIEEVL